MLFVLPFSFSDDLTSIGVHNDSVWPSVFSRPVAIATSGTTYLSDSTDEYAEFGQTVWACRVNSIVRAGKAHLKTPATGEQASRLLSTAVLRPSVSSRFSPSLVGQESPSHSNPASSHLTVSRQLELMNSASLTAQTSALLTQTHVTTPDRHTSRPPQSRASFAQSPRLPERRTICPLGLWPITGSPAVARRYEEHELCWQRLQKKLFPSQDSLHLRIYPQPREGPTNLGDPDPPRGHSVLRDSQKLDSPRPQQKLSQVSTDKWQDEERDGLIRQKNESLGQLHNCLWTSSPAGQNALPELQQQQQQEEELVQTSEGSQDKKASPRQQHLQTDTRQEGSGVFKPPQHLPIHSTDQPQLKPQSESSFPLVSRCGSLQGEHLREGEVPCLPHQNMHEQNFAMQATEQLGLEQTRSVSPNQQLEWPLLAFSSGNSEHPSQDHAFRQNARSFRQQMSEIHRSERPRSVPRQLSQPDASLQLGLPLLSNRELQLQSGWQERNSWQNRGYTAKGKERRGCQMLRQPTGLSRQEHIAVGTPTAKRMPEQPTRLSFHDAEEDVSQCHENYLQSELVDAFHGEQEAPLRSLQQQQHHHRKMQNQHSTPARLWLHTVMQVLSPQQILQTLESLEQIRLEMLQLYHLVSKYAHMHS
ncbi:unnamed protein product [Protopolystoma xenopodis]|uniref:Uncharacterized protein n=1 Tax=Protopolystoma xenopodis TaxID=117903 RepID=A0A448WPL8_9PLAT|nr:unnamed protein product [Protopolystoma xenopodis]